MLPAAPGYVGTFEYFTVLGLALFGIGQEAALAYALLAHIFQLIPVSAVGLFFAWRRGFHRLSSVQTLGAIKSPGLRVEG